MIDRLNTHLKLYGEELYQVVRTTGLEPELFSAPDHVAYRSHTSEGFEDVLSGLRGRADEVSYVDIDDRRIAAAWFATPLSVRKFGQVHWLEIIEPEPKKSTDGIVGIEHMEFYYQDLARARRLLNQKSLLHTFESTKSHSWVSGVINNFGFEVKFTDRKFGDMVGDQIASGEAHVL